MIANLNINASYNSQLPKINLKRFDEVQKEYGGQTSLLHSSHRTNAYLENISKVEQNTQLKNALNTQSNRSISLLQESKLKIINQSKQRYTQWGSLGFLKSLSNSRKEINKEKQNQSKNKINADSKTNLKSIYRQIVLERVPRLFFSKLEQKIKIKSDPKLQISSNTKYEDWIPKKNKARQSDQIKQTNRQTLQKFEESFFFKCRSNSTILKLSKGQNIK